MSTFTTRPEIRGTFGVVASTHWLASAVAMSMLERGGNAFDAAVAAGFTLQIAEPHLNGPGGDVPILLQPAGAAEPRVLCGQGPAPAGATIAHYQSLGLTLVPGTGFLAAVVPGAFGAWLTLLRDHGTMPLETVLAPAVAYARDGCPAVPRITETIENVRELFETEWPSSAATFLPGGAAPVPGGLYTNPVLADTYQRIIDESRHAGSRETAIDAALGLFYEGFVAEAIDRFVTVPHLDVSGRRHAGVLTGQDLASWRPGYEDALSVGFGDFEVYKCGPWSQGPVLLQQLRLLDGFDVGRMDPLGPDFVHTVVECAKLAFADREAWYGDPVFVDVPLAALLDPAYADERRALVADTASLALRPGHPDGRVPRMAAGPGAGAAIGTGIGEPTMGDYPESARRAASGDTCHVDVVDRDGNMVAATPSGGWLQSSPVVPSLGFALSTRAQMFWLEEGLPASLAPGKRPRTTLTPSMARRNGEPYLAFGTPGGDQQDQWTTTFFLHHALHRMNLQEAIDAPLFHTTHFPSSFYPRGSDPGAVHIETRFPRATLEELERRGHRLTRAGDWTIGRMAAAGREPGGMLKAAATPRGMQGYAAGR